MSFYSVPRWWVLTVMVSASLTSVDGVAQSFLSPGDYPALDELIERQDKQVRHISSYPFGWSLDVYPASELAVQTFEDFINSDSNDLEVFSGKHLFEFINGFEEYGDLGMFGGVPAAGMAFRYIALRDSGVTGPELDLARAAVVRAIENAHVFLEITGVPGVLARGVRRLLPEDPSDGPVPGVNETLVPFTDANGDPLPQPKDNGTWRQDNSGGTLPVGHWIWVDSASKDQWDGYTFGLAALYDAAKGDPSIDQLLVERMEEDANAMAAMLRQTHVFMALDGKEHDYDLVIMDADGRPTKFHDLNPFMFEGAKFTPGGSEVNTFNLITALGVVTALYHVGGDDATAAWVYEDLYKSRKYLELVQKTKDEGAIDYIYAGLKTNYSNVNMIAVSLFTAIYFESDPDVVGVLQQFARDRWWDVVGVKQSARHLKNPFFGAIYMAVGPDVPTAEDVEVNAGYLSRFPLGPYANRQVVNCDSDEIVAKKCIAIDGVTELVLEDTPEGVKATEALDPAIRPPSNYDSRSCPFDVNGGGGLYLNAGGDLTCAYWMMRALKSRSDSTASSSPMARAHVPVIERPEPDPEPVDEVEADSDVGGKDADFWNQDSSTEEVVSDLATADTSTGHDQAGGDAVADVGGVSAGSSGCSMSAGAGVTPAVGLMILLLALLIIRLSAGRVRGWR